MEVSSVKWPRVPAMASTPTMICAALTLAVLVFALPVSAQVKRPKAPVAASSAEKPAAIVGTVNYKTGGAVSAATVTVENAAGFSQSAISDAQGSYELTDLAAGTYTLSVTVGEAKIFGTSVV